MPLQFFLRASLVAMFSLLAACGEPDGPSLLDPDDLPRPGNLVGYWKMERNWSDSSGRDNHGTVGAGTPSFTANAQVGAYAGRFDGSSHIDVPDSPSLGITTGFTAMTWLYVAAPPALNFWLFSKNPSGFATGYGIAFDRNTGQIWPHLGIGGGLQNPKSAGSVTYGQWNLITVTYDGSTIEIYLNGAHDSSLSVSGTVGTNNSPLYIGNSPGSFTEFLDGIIDNLAIWNVALTPAEIQDVYTRQFQ
jgi:hypothetical protein